MTTAHTPDARLSPQQMRDAFAEKIAAMPPDELEATVLGTCLGWLGSWGELRDLYDDEVTELCRLFEKRGQRARWDELVAQAKRTHHERKRGRVEVSDQDSKSV